MEPLVSSPLRSRVRSKLNRSAPCQVLRLFKEGIPAALRVASAGALPLLGRQGLDPHHWNILVGSRREVTDQGQAETWAAGGT